VQEGGKTGMVQGRARARSKQTGANVRTGDGVALEVPVERADSSSLEREAHVLAVMRVTRHMASGPCAFLAEWHFDLILIKSGRNASISGGGWPREGASLCSAALFLLKSKPGCPSQNEDFVLEASGLQGQRPDIPRGLSIGGVD
jgi:hypothetical protein